MSKKCGLSLEEKRDHLLQIFYESHEFFLLRDLEKLGPKKGVINQTVKDVIQSLVGDDLVLKDKIGSFYEREAALDELKIVEHQHKKLKRMQPRFPIQLQIHEQITSSHYSTGKFPQAKEQLENMYKEGQLFS